MATLECTHCGFDLSILPASVRVEATDGPTKDLACPMCGNHVPVAMDSLGILVRGSGPATTFTRWKLSERDDTGPTIKTERKDGKPGRLIFRFDALKYTPPEDVLFSSVPAFLAEDGALVFPTLPIRPDCFDCIDEQEARRLAESPEGIGAAVGGVYQFTLPLRGLTAAQKKELRRVARPVHTPEPGAPSKENAFGQINLRIWPRVAVSAWRYYLAGIAGTGEAGNKLVGENKVRVKVRTDATEDWLAVDNVQGNGSARARALDGRPTWLAVEMGDADKLSSGGLFLVPSVRDSRAEIPPTRFGLDFGTSNTCVVVEGSMTSTGKPELLPKVDEQKWNEYLLRGGPEFAAPTGPDLWPSARGFGKLEDLFASELVFPRPKRDMVAQLSGADGWRFGIDFGLPGAGVAPKFDEAAHTLGELKWVSMLQKQDPLYAPKVVKLQSHYISAVMMMAYLRAAASSTHASPGGRIIYSYPMSFPADELTNLMESMDEATQRLERMTGLPWDRSRGVDESTAAGENAGTTDADVLVYVDMGGGSTDIGVKLSRGKGKADAVYLTSVIYGGTAMLRGYAADGNAKGVSCLQGKTTIDLLRRRIRESPNTKAVLSDPLLFRHEPVVKRRTGHFYGYIIEYVARLLAAGFLDQRFKTREDGEWKFRENAKFSFFFLGNGWGFYSLTANEPQAALAAAIYSRMQELIKGEKTDYAKSARKGLSIAEDPKCPPMDGVPHPKAAVAVGVLKAESAARLGDAKPPPRSGILGWPTRAGEKEIPWFAYYTLGGDAGPTPPGGKAKSATGGISLDDDDDQPAAVTPTPWYVRLPINTRPSWQPDAAPKLPEHLTPISDPSSPEDSLDPDLNATRGTLQSQCSPGETGWFAKGAYEVLLEKLFAEKLGEVGA